VQRIKEKDKYCVTKGKTKISISKLPINLITKHIKIRLFFKNLKNGTVLLKKLASIHSTLYIYDIELNIIRTTTVFVYLNIKQ